MRSAVGQPDEGRSHHFFRLALGATVLLFCLSASAAQKLSRDLPQAANGRQVNVIVQFASHPSQADFDRITYRGARLKAKFSHLRSAVFTVAPEALRGIAADRHVAYVSADRAVRAT